MGWQDEWKSKLGDGDPQGVGEEHPRGVGGESNSGVGGSDTRGTVVPCPAVTDGRVTIIVKMGQPGVDGQHSLEHTGSDLKSYLRGIRGGVSLALRARIHTVHPDVRGPHRLYHVPAPGDVITFRRSTASIANEMGQRIQPDSEATAHLVGVGRAAVEARAKKHEMTDDALVGLAQKLLNGE